MKTAFSHKVKGASLVEVLVSSLLLAGGLSGFMALQTSALQSIQATSYRAQAVFLASDLISRIRVNAQAISEYHIKGIAGKVIIEQPDCFNCTPAQIAALDLHEWLATVKAQLPEGEVTVNSDGQVISILLSWNEKKTAREKQDKNDTPAHLQFQAKI